MILQALYQLAQREGLVDDPDYEPKAVAWLVRVAKGGKLLGIEGTHYAIPTEGRKKPKELVKEFRIPKQPTGRCGTKAPACFFVDNAKYVFGLPTKGKSFAPEEGREKSGWFREQIAQCAKATNDEAAIAILNFLEDAASGRIVVSLADKCSPSDLFAFIFDPDVDLLAHDRTRIREHWIKQRAGSLGKGIAGSRCLVSGQTVRDVGLFPLIERVPGASPSRIALVSFNKNAFESYGWDGNDNAPISREAAETCATALNRLLHPAYPDPKHPSLTLPRRHLRLSGDTALCYWSARASADEFCAIFASLLEADPANVRELYRSIWRGKMPKIEDPSAFYALTLTGMQGRAIVRDWFETSVADAARNLAVHFADLDIVRNTPNPREREQSPQVPLSILLESLAPQGARDKIPAPFIAQLVRAALHGTPYPFSILQRALERMRAEVGNASEEGLEGFQAKQRTDARAALIKAFLNRRKRFHPQTTSYEEVQPDMDPNNTSEGYALGRLMAVLERIQQEAIGNVNASVVDRYFSGASAAPKSVFVRLLKNARHHVGKAKDDPAKGGIVFLLDRLVDELADRFDPKHNGFPAHLDLDQQGLFVLGYHQMRKWIWMNKEERAEWEKNHPTTPRAYLWSTKSETSASSQQI